MAQPAQAGSWDTAARNDSSSGQSGPYSAWRRARSAMKRVRCSAASVSSDEGVGEFDAGEIQFEAFRNPRVPPGSAGPRRLGMPANG